MVAGSPVSTQSPASSRPRTGVRVPGRARLPGGQGERRLPLPDGRRMQNARLTSLREALVDFARSHRDQLVVGPPHDVSRPTGDQGQVRPLAPKQPALVERPLEHAPRQPKEHLLQHGPVVPEVDRDNGRTGRWPPLGRAARRGRPAQAGRRRQGPSTARRRSPLAREAARRALRLPLPDRPRSLPALPISSAPRHAAPPATRARVPRTARRAARPAARARRAPRQGRTDG